MSEISDFCPMCETEAIGLLRELESVKAERDELQRKLDDLENELLERNERE